MNFLNLMALSGKKIEIPTAASILDRATSKMATSEAEQKDNKVWAWIKERGIRRVLFKRWVFVWCDMKNYRG